MYDSQVFDGTTTPITGSLRLASPPADLIELLQSRARVHPDRIGFTFIEADGKEQTLTFAQLDRRARSIAATLQQATEPGQRALLVYPPGLELICGFFGCIYAQVLAVPATYPKPRRPMSRLTAIARDCEAAIALTNVRTQETLGQSQTAAELSSVAWMATDSIPLERAQQWQRPQIAPDDLTFLQYTSGSISDPKGVMVSHRNLLHNLEMIRKGFDLAAHAQDVIPTSVFWLPVYHDMGLIGGMLEPIYVGGHTVLMPPASFLMRPITWLNAISQYQANISGAPNFAYDLCVEKISAQQRATLDLSSWKLAFCGAEPIRAETLDRFSATFAECGFQDQAFYPCYGLAEATLIAAGGRGPSRPIIKRVQRAPLSDHQVVDANGHPEGQVRRLVGCGQPLLDQEIIIADLLSHRTCQANQIGEIWIKGPNVAAGYWNRPDETQQTFAGQLVNDSENKYLRTGDLGFWSDDGHLFITGRLKDVIIIRGRNYYPQDIEHTVRQSHPSLHCLMGAAFAVERDGQDRLVVVHEVDRHQSKEDFHQVIRSIRHAIAVEHELEVDSIQLIRQASLPVTTSGKPRRIVCRQRYLADELKVLSSWHKANNEVEQPPVLSGQTATLENDQMAETIETWLLEWLSQRAPIAREQLDRDRPFAEYGLDSLAAVELSGALEEWLQIKLTPILAWNYPTPAALSRYLAREASAVESEPKQLDEGSAPTQASEFEQMLAEIESLDDGEAEAAIDELQSGLDDVL